MTIQPKPTKILVVSGKKGAGKDTLAPALAPHLSTLDPIHLSFADPLKDTVDDYINLIRQHDTQPSAVAALAEPDPDAPVEVRQHMVDLLFTAVHEDPQEHARSHSSAAVAALQFYGTEFRRATDPDYWVKRAVASAEAALADGRFPYFTDARFPNEVSGLSADGGLAVRLDVDAEEQARRLLERDGRVPDAVELSHSSEIALDDYEGFDIRVTSLPGSDKTLNLVLSELNL